MGAIISQLNNRLTFDFAAYLRGRTSLSQSFRSIATSATSHRQRKGTLQVLNGSAGLVAGVAGATALSLAAAPLTLGLSVPIHAAATASIVGNSIAAASVTSSAASFGFGRSGDRDIARRLQNLKRAIECIAKKDAEINSLLKQSTSTSCLGDKAETVEVRDLQACRGLCNIWEEWDLAQKKDTKSATIAYDLPLHIFQSQGIIFGTKTIIDGTKNVTREEHDLAAALVQAADAIDADTEMLRSLGDRRFRYWGCIAEERRLSHGRLTYIDGGGGCKRYMVVTYHMPGGHNEEGDCQDEPTRIKSDSTNVICLPEGTTNIKIHFLVRGGGTVKKIDRSHPKQPWVKDESSGEYQVDVFDLESGDGSDVVFLLRGSFTHSYVHRAWDFGRNHPVVKPRKWEWWPGAEEECDKLLPDIGLRTLHITTGEYSQESCGLGFGLGLDSCRLPSSV